jgi:hypothetical protein
MNEKVSQNLLFSALYIYTHACAPAHVCTMHTHIDKRMRKNKLQVPSERPAWNLTPLQVQHFLGFSLISLRHLTWSHTQSFLCFADVFLSAQPCLQILQHAVHSSCFFAPSTLCIQSKKVSISKTGLWLSRRSLLSILEALDLIHRKK